MGWALPPGGRRAASSSPASPSRQPLLRVPHSAPGRGELGVGVRFPILPPFPLSAEAEAFSVGR